MLFLYKTSQGGLKRIQFIVKYYSLYFFSIYEESCRTIPWKLCGDFIGYGEFMLIVGLCEQRWYWTAQRTATVRADGTAA